MPAPTAPSGLAAGQHVIVRTLHIGAIPATVERADGSAITVALTVKDNRYKRLIGQDVAVESSSGRGIHKLTGTLKGERDGVLSIELTGVERIQRREFVRVAAHVTVNVRGIDEPLGGETVTIDISGAGIRISDPWSLPLGLDVRVELKLPEGGPLHSLGRVVRAGAEADQKGIRLDGIARPDEDRLMRYIREREVQALRAARNR
jgi:PilZ domain